MYHSFGREMPGSFVEAAHTFAAQHTELQARFTVAIDDIGRLAFEKGSTPLGGSTEETVLYTLDGNISDAGEHDDYAQRLHIDSRPLPSAVETGISFRRHMPLHRMSADATIFDSRNDAQLVHLLPDGEEVRYTVNPSSGTLDQIHRPTDLLTAIGTAYNKTVLHTSRLALPRDVLVAFDQAALADAKNPGGVIDNVPRYTEQSRDIENVGFRIRRLVAAISNSSETSLSAELVGQLLTTDIDRVASLAVIHSSMYYDKDRGPISFDRRLQWVAEHAGTFCTTVKAFLESQTGEFHNALATELIPVQAAAQAAEMVATDTQPPKATYADGSFWKVSRAL